MYMHEYIFSASKDIWNFITDNEVFKKKKKKKKKKQRKRKRRETM